MENLRETLYWKVERTLKKLEYDFQISPEPIQILRHTYSQEIVNFIFESLEKNNHFFFRNFSITGPRASNSESGTSKRLSNKTSICGRVRIFLRMVR